MAAMLLLVGLLAGCSAASSSDAGGSTAGGSDGRNETTVDSTDFLDSSTVHAISVVFDQADYEAMIEAYATTGEKEWIAADVTIDGITYTEVGIRLKGNSSLAGLRTGLGRGPGSDVSSDDPEQLPWLIRLDKYVDGQNHEGIHDLVVRSNNTETALNEAVALALLAEAGLASQDAAYAAFSVNDGADVLRLIVEHPDDVWLEDAFADPGVLYKAEATGDYSYRGEDPDDYNEVFDLEAGEDNGDLTYLIEFLDFINNAEDDSFVSELEDWLDIDSFATYLAMQELIDNFDDIDGPGNNSYLYYDIETELFTVVPWDHNLAFGVLNDGGGAGGFTPPDGFDPEARPPRGDIEELPSGPEGGELTPLDGGADGLPGDGGPPAFDVPRDGFPGGSRGGSNILVERFLANDEWQSLYAERLDDLRASLYESGVAGAILDSWADLLEAEAGDLVAASVITHEGDSIAAHFS